MLGTFKKEADGDAPPLSWRVWLLVPLTVVGLAGVVVPFAVSPPKDAKTVLEERRAAEPRVPYADELLPLLEKDLDAEILLSIRALHDRARREADSHDGTIAESRKKQVDALLERYGGR